VIHAIFEQFHCLFIKFDVKAGEIPAYSSQAIQRDEQPKQQPELEQAISRHAMERPSQKSVHKRKGEEK
jgi:hypothetical protein